MFPCNLTDTLESTLTFPHEDPELRISAYLGMMRCANYDTTALVQNILKEEQVNQGMQQRTKMNQAMTR